MNKNLILIPISDNFNRLEDIIPHLEVYGFDMLIIYNGNEDEISDILKLSDKIKAISYENSEGIGSLLMTGFDYARDYAYENILIHNCDKISSFKYITTLVENLEYGYDIINLSRILENYEHEKIPSEIIEIISSISGSINEITEYVLTDPMSGIIGLKVKALENMEFTEFTNAIFLQIWIQASHYSLSSMELPVESDTQIGTELADFEDPIGECLAIIETEKYLYKKGELN